MCERRGQDIGRQADAVPPACQCPPGGVRSTVSCFYFKPFFSLALWWKFGSAKNKEECFLLFPLAPTPRAGATSRAALAASCCETRETHRDDEGPFAIVGSLSRARTHTHALFSSFQEQPRHPVHRLVTHVSRSRRGLESESSLS